METIKLDLIPGKKMPSLHASQYDDGREHGIDLFENGVAYKLDGTETLTINERKGDDCICSLDIENTFADSNHIVFASTEQMCAVWGNNICELVIAKGDVKLGTLNFILEVESSPSEGGIESESEISNLERQITEITEQVIGDDYYTAEETDEAIATAIEGKADKTYVDTELAKKTNKTYVDTELAKKADKNNTYTKSEVDTLIDNLPEPMIFKGTLGVGGTIQTLPTASASNEGWMFKCITAGTYAGLTLKVGDTVTCFNPPNTSNYYWDKTGSQDTDTDTWRNIKVNGDEKLGNGISSGSVDFVGSENIDVEFDSNGNKVGVKTKNIYTKTEVDAIVSDAIYNVLPDDTASGSVANFNTSLELPIKSLVVDVNAVQESGTPTPATPLPISGWSEVNVPRCGSNLWNEEWEEGVYSNTNGNKGNIPNRIRSKGYIPCKPSTSYFYFYGGSIANLWLRICYYDKNFNFISVDNNKLFNRSYTTPSTAFYLTICCINADITTYSNDISVNYPSSDTEYHAYNPNSQEVTIALGGTYYGGHFTQDKDGHRQFEVTHGIDDLGEQSWSYGTWGAGSVFSATLSSAKPQSVSSVKGDIICSIYNNVTSSDMYSNNPNYSMCLNNNVVRIANSDYSNKDTFKSAMSGIMLVCKLATPIIIDLPDGEPIITLNGTNNIYADTGDTEVVFKSSVNDYVSAHSGGNLLGMGGVYLGGAKSGGSEEEPTEESEDTEKTKEIDEPKEEIKTIGDMKKLGGE